jgi:hypothetical protein
MFLLNCYLYVMSYDIVLNFLRIAVFQNINWYIICQSRPSQMLDAMKTDVNWRYSSTILDWLALRLGRFTPGEKVPGTHWIGVWVGPGAVLDVSKKRKISCRCSGIEDFSFQYIAPVYSHWAIGKASLTNCISLFLSEILDAASWFSFFPPPALGTEVFNNDV